MINLLVVSDVRIYREGLCDVLHRYNDFNITGTAETLQEIMMFLTRYDINVLLLDTANLNSLTIVQVISSRFPQVKILAFGLSEKKENIVEFAESGISGYVSKDSSVNELINAISAIFRGESECSAKVAGVLFERLSILAKNKNSRKDIISLTPRELEVAKLVSQGLTNSEIASHLNIRITTAKTHVHHVLDKLGAQRRSQVIRYISPNPLYDITSYSNID